MTREEAIKNIKRLIGFSDTLDESIFTLFPELQESEDERIRKFICSIIDNLEPKDFVGVKKMNVIAWLEKQKINTEGDFGRGYDCGYKACLNSHGAEFFEKQKEQKPIEFDEYKIIKKHITEDVLSSEVNKRLTECGWYVTDEKPAEWSEEDEKKRNLLIDILEVNHPNEYFKVNPANTLNMEAIHVEELVDWLKSLKERITINDKNYDETRTEKRN